MEEIQILAHDCSTLVVKWNVVKKTKNHFLLTNKLI